MVIISTSITAYLSASVLILAATIYHARKHQDSGIDIFLVLLLLHTLYILYFLFLCRPPNIFWSLHVPLNAAPEYVRTAIRRHVRLDSDTPLPRVLETLLSRISSLEMRMLYVRFGQDVLQDCEHCRTFDEFALFALPGALLEYIREAAVLGLLTVHQSGRTRWRTYVLGALVCAAILEGYQIITATVKIPENGMGVFMWHDYFWAIRQSLFLVLPIITYLLPPSALPEDPSSTIAATQAVLQDTMMRVISLRVSRSAVMRDPALRAAAGEWWDRGRTEGEWARGYENVRRLAGKLNKSFVRDEQGRMGKLQVKAREFAEQVWMALTAPVG